jgi:dolichyl-phosphate-mannose-protein mannosyltransferase
MQFSHVHKSRILPSDRYLMWLLLAIFGALCFLSQREKSVTVDEFNHFPSGIYNLLTGDWRMDRQSPPLVKCFPGLSAMFTAPKILLEPFVQDPNPWKFGYDFMHRNSNRYVAIFEWGRVLIILIGCFGGWILYHFTRQIFGSKGALFALLLFIFNPNVLAHSRLVTIDIGATAIFLLSVFAFWKFLGNMGLKNTAISGVTLGLAQVSKFTCLILYPLFMIFFAIVLAHNGYMERRENPTTMGKSIISAAAPIAAFAFMVLISLFVINSVYVFSNVFFCFKDYAFESTALNALTLSPIKSIPIPLPLEYVRGFDIQLDISSGKSPFYMGYLMGKHSMAGWPHYYLIGMLVKNPEAMVVILLLSLYAWCKTTPRPALRTWLCVWGTVLVYLSYFSVFTNTPIGIRFLLPIFPLLFLAAGALLSRNFMANGRIRILLSLLTILYVLPAIIFYPNYLSYFNWVSGGPKNGHYWLIDSNLDWGQDLPALKKYMVKKSIDRIKLGYFGRVDPHLYGINYDLAQKEIDGGVHAISVNFLIGRPYYLLGNKGRLTLIDFNHYRRYRKLKPKAILGNTIYIFEKEEAL